MNGTPRNKFRDAAEILERGRARLVESLADEVLDRSEDLLESGYLLNEFLENQGSRIHFLSLLVAQLEQSAGELDEKRAARVAQATPKAKPRTHRTASSKKVDSQAGGQSRHETSREPESRPDES